MNVPKLFTPSFSLNLKFNFWQNFCSNELFFFREKKCQMSNQFPCPLSKAFRKPISNFWYSLYSVSPSSREHFRVPRRREIQELKKCWLCCVGVLFEKVFMKVMRTSAHDSSMMIWFTFRLAFSRVSFADVNINVDHGCFQMDCFFRSPFPTEVLIEFSLCLREQR